MKLQVIIPLLVILSIGLFSNLVYADHPEPIELTFNQESYEFGDTLIIDAYTPEPRDSFIHDPSVNLYVSDIGFVFADWESGGSINATGYSTFVGTLNSTDLVTNPFTVYGTWVTFEDRGGENPTRLSHNTVKVFNSTLNSDYNSILFQHVNDIPQINATINSHTANIESVNSRLSAQQLTIDDMYIHMDSIDADITRYNSQIISLNNTIISQDTIIRQMVTEIDEIMRFLDTIITVPSQLPQITSLIADDPDDLDDVYSQYDTIAITFDYDTNMPGGTIIQNRVAVNDMFAFTELIGQQYRGQWTAPDTFIVIVNNISNATIEIGSTTVTPAGITPILSDDGRSIILSTRSPVLSGDFGTP